MSFRARTLLAGTAATLAFVAGAPSAVAQPGTKARLEGTFQLSGRITVARHVRGEHVGEVVRRTWMFTPLCATGACAQVRLVRERAVGTDTLILTQTTPGHYAGAGRFFAPVKCAGTVYASGIEIPFRINVQITATVTAADGTTTAAAITATYVNKSRLNLTRCVFVPGHDAARYLGTTGPAAGPG